MITQILDGGDFDDIKAVRVPKIKNGEYKEIPIRDLTKYELMDITRTYYIALQQMAKKLDIIEQKIDEKFYQKITDNGSIN